MALSPGTKIGSYHIESLLGAGGMGEVYRARDTKLGRAVALKVLPEALARDAQRMARFEREAQLLASLNHPNIAAIYGLEDSGGTRALVMELVEGPTLAERISVPAVSDRGPAMRTPPAHPVAARRAVPLPVDDALGIAKQIAEGLEAAHERGVIHRDLKPANIKITPDGTVKILDFGLAKALESTVAAVYDRRTGERSSPLQDSPTLSAMATQAGMILGTAAYMSPEAARGKVADRRADIWAFGCVLYEMLTGKQAFEGETVSDILASVIRAEPDWSALVADIPPAIHKLLARTLVKDPKRRLQAIGEARIVIEETLSGADSVAAVSDRQVPGAGETPALRRALPWVVAGAFAVLFLASLSVFRRGAEPAGVVHSSILPPPNSVFAFSGIDAGPVAISPDGRRLAFAATDAQRKKELWVRPLDSPAAQPLAGTEGASFPFWSPDSRLIGFFADGKLKKVDASGAPPIALCDAPLGRGGSWSREGTILFAPASSSPVYRVLASGGVPAPVTNLDRSRQEFSHRWPFFLPDGRRFLYYVSSGLAQNRGVYVGSLDGSSPKFLLPSQTNAIYAPPGYVFFVRDGTLMVQPFVARMAQLTGDAFPLGASVQYIPGADRSVISASENGVLAYASGSVAAGLNQMLWFDRGGKALAALGEPGTYLSPRLSPDGKRLAVVSFESGKADVWVYDLARSGVKTRLTFDPSIQTNPTWSPDGLQIAFWSNRKGGSHSYQKAANGTGNEEIILEGNTSERVRSWSSDGRYIAYERSDPGGKMGFGIWILPLFGDRKPFQFLQSQFNTITPEFSPNGKWMAYVSDDSGRNEVYAAPFPSGAGKWPVSTGGGRYPRWRRDGKELFYLSADNRIMAAEIAEKHDSLEVGSVRTLFQARSTSLIGWMYDATPDGRKFLVVTEKESGTSEPITLIVNWPALLKKQ